MSLLTFFSAKEAVWPPRTSLTGMRLRWIDLTAIDRKLPKGSGPSSRVSFSLIRPLSVVPDTTVPTPCQGEEPSLLCLSPPQTPSLPGARSVHAPCTAPPRGTHGYRVGVIYLELSRFFLPVAGAGGQEVEEHLEQVKVLTCDIGDLEYWAHPK